MRSMLTESNRMHFLPAGIFLMISVMAIPRSVKFAGLLTYFIRGFGGH